MVGGVKGLVKSAFDALDFDYRELLAVSAAARVVLAAAVLEDADFFAAFVFQDLCGDGGAGHERGADFGRGPLAEEDNLVEVDGVAGGGAGEKIDGEDVAFLDRELPALGDDGRFHVWFLKRGGRKGCGVAKASRFFGSRRNSLSFHPVTR